MTYRANRSFTRASQRTPDDGFELDALLHPASAFAHPMAVVNDPDLTLNEKRAILASWASDACAVETAPELRHPPGGRAIQFDDIMDALRLLDSQGGATGKPEPHYRRVLAHRRPGVFGRRRSSDEGDRSLN